MKKLFIVLIFITLCIIDSLLNHTSTTQMFIPLIPLITGGISLGSSILGNVQASKASKANEKILKGLQDENKSDYIKEYYRGALDNPGSQAYLKKLDQTIKDNTKATENTAAATGATQENVLAAKQANNEVVSDAVGGLIQNEDNRKQQVKQNYFTTKTNLSGQQMNQNSQKAQNWQNIAAGIGQAAGSLASAYLMNPQKSLLGSNLSTPTTPAVISANNAAPAVSNVPKPVIKL